MKPGDLIEQRYHIGALIGRGGMGEVFLATDNVLEKQVAIKTLLPQTLADERSAAQLKREVRLAQELKHANICATHHLHISGGEPFIVMEYVEGPTLANFIYSQPDHKLNETQAQSLADQILAGMEAAHASGVVHRDLKSTNIVIKRDGTIRIMDFGIAAQIKETVARATGAPLTLSVHYASPEQINGAAPHPSMDIYSFGCILYEMLTGSPPFTQGDVLHQQLTKSPPALPPGCGKLGSIALACLKKDSRKRPPSASEIRTAIGLANPATIKRPTLPESSWRAPLARWLPRFIAALLVVVLSVATVVYFRKPNDPPGSSPEKSAAPYALRVESPQAGDTALKRVNPPPLAPGSSPSAPVKAKLAADGPKVNVPEILNQVTALCDRGLYGEAASLLRIAIDKSHKDPRLLAELDRVKARDEAEGAAAATSGQTGKDFRK